MLRGACEALFTPRPLGDFYDLVHALGGPLLAQLQADARPIDLFHGLLDSLRKSDQPSVIVLEDVHWTDDATLDFIRFVARRITRAPIVLVLTFRDDEIGADHPLAAVLGELAPDSRPRLRLPALSRVTVERLALEASRNAFELYRITGSNPFFVTEVLHAESDTVAPSVREVRLALACGNDDAQREVVRNFDAIGAHGTASHVRTVMREQAVKGIPKGPQPTTMANPVGLTDRELEVLGLLAKDLSNATIAIRLHRSIRMVENHVAAITGKLGADSRQEAAVLARARGVLPAGVTFAVSPPLLLRRAMRKCEPGLMKMRSGPDGKFRHFDYLDLAGIR